MRTLIVGDTHIEEKSIPELTGIFNELLKIKADRFVQLGDFFEHNRPTPLELKFATSIVKKLRKKFKDVTIISGTGEHDILRDVSVIEFFKDLGVKTIKGDYVKDNILYAHFMVYESKLVYGTGRCGIKDLAKYDKVFLGHQHNYQELKKDKIFHPGSVRFVNFNEVTDLFKRVVILNDGKVQFKRLKSPYPMLDVISLKELKKVKPGKKKVRLIISSFKQFKREVNDINQYKHKFNQFKVKLNFDNKIQTKEEQPQIAKSKKLQEILREGIAKIEDKDVKKLLEGLING